MPDASARFAMPFIVPGQAQKELFHNEALVLADALLHPAVEGEPAASPPAAPEPGQGWIVAAGSTGAWAGKSQYLAVWTRGGWRFAAPVPGMQVWQKDAGFWIQWTGTGWNSGEVPAARIVIGGEQVVGPRLPEVPSPSGGTVIDVEARAALALLIVAIRTHGLTE